jgi:hypothetical protein
VGLDVVKQLFVPLEFEMRVQPTLHEDLVAPQRDGLADLLEQDLSVEHIGLGIADFPVESAEVANGCADVGVVDVPIDVVGPVRARMKPSGHRIGRAT